MGQASSCSVVSHRPSVRRLGDCVYRRFNLGLEIEPESWRPGLVILHGLPKLHLGFAEDSRGRHLPNFALISPNTSAAGRPMALPSRTI